MRFNCNFNAELITSDHKEELNPELRANHSRTASFLSLLSGMVQEFISYKPHPTESKSDKAPEAPPTSESKPEDSAAPTSPPAPIQ